MNKDDLKKVVDTILQRGDPKYTTPSGALLELLREKAKNNEIHLLAEISSIYTKEYPEVISFIAHRVPGILSNHYFSTREDLDYNKFIQWSIKNENWAESLIANVFNPEKLEKEIENIIIEANNTTN